MPPFLALRAWVDLAEPEGYKRLLAGIHGVAPGHDPDAPEGPKTTKDPAVSIARLPVPGPHFLGRDAELQRLDQAWDDDDTRVFVLAASSAAVLLVVIIAILLVSGSQSPSDALKATFLYANEGRYSNANNGLSPQLRAAQQQTGMSKQIWDSVT